MEKKLTDEEIVKALERCGDIDNCYDCPIMGEMERRNCMCQEVVLDLIHRLQEDYSKLKKRYIKVLDLNENVIEEQKNEIERLKGFIDFKTANVMCDKCKEQVVKDTAKDSLEQFVCAMVNMEYVGVNDDLYYQMLELKDTLLKEKYGVEVE